MAHAEFAILRALYDCLLDSAHRKQFARSAAIFRRQKSVVLRNVKGSVLSYFLLPNSRIDATILGFFRAAAKSSIGRFSHIYAIRVLFSICREVYKYLHGYKDKYLKLTFL